MKKATAYIVGAGDFSPRGFEPKKGDLVIAADGGYDSLRRFSLGADVLVGDMDSLKNPPPGLARLRFPAKKDLTDMGLCLRLAQGRGYRRFLLFGALGKRLDHTLANLQLLFGLARDGYAAKIVSHDLIIHAIHQNQLNLPPIPKGALISVFCLGEKAEGVSIKGLAYPLTDAIIQPFAPLGISNEGLGKPAQIGVKQGGLLVFQYQA